MSSLQGMNNELKVFVNEASGISNKCRSKLLKLVEKYFYVDLPDDNFLNVDVSILENGNILMRDVEYKTSKEISKEDSIEIRFEEFKKEVEELLEKKGTNFDAMKKKNGLINLLVLILIFIVMIVIAIYAIKLLIHGDLRGFIWLVIIVGYYLLPITGHNLRDRLVQAKNYLRSIFKK